MSKSAIKAGGSVRTSVMLPADCYEQIQALAEENKVSTAWVIRHALVKFLDGQDGQLRLPLFGQDG